EVVNTRVDLGLGAGGVLQLLRLGEGLSGVITGGFCLGLHGLDLRLGGLGLAAELLVLITHLPNLVAQFKEVLVLLAQASQFFAGDLGLRLVGVSLGGAELL